jgi:hypothetical protein
MRGCWKFALDAVFRELNLMAGSHDPKMLLEQALCQLGTVIIHHNRFGRCL